MSTAFAAAVDVLFADPNLSVPGTFTASPLGSPIAVRVVLTQNDPIIQFGEVGVRSPGVKLLLKVTEVGNPKEGDTVTVGSTTYIIRDARRDPHNLEWTLDVDATGGN